MKTWLTIRADKEEIKATLHASAPYKEDGSTATASRDIDVPDELKAQIKALLEQHADAMKPALTLTVAKALVVESELALKVIRKPK